MADPQMADPRTMAYPVRARQTLAVKAQLKGPVEASLVVVATLEEAGNMASRGAGQGCPGTLWPLPSAP